MNTKMLKKWYFRNAFRALEQRGVLAGLVLLLAILLGLRAISVQKIGYGE